MKSQKEVLCMKFAARINSFRQSPLLSEEGKNLSLAQCLEKIGKIKGITHVELNYPEHFQGLSVPEVGKLVKKNHLQVSGVALRYKGKYLRGEFTNPDEKLREVAIAETIAAVEACIELGGEVTTIWLANDGFDYPFQCDYNRALDLEVEALRKVAEKFPKHKISFEYKPYQPRAFSFIGDIATTLLVLEEVGAKNMGVTLDFCHMLMKKESPAYSLALAARKNRLMGFHLNDGYKDNDDGFMLGSVHLMQTLEFIYYAKKYNYQGVNYFDTFPMREDPSAEVEANIETYLALERHIESYGLKEIEKLIAAGDAVQVQHFMLDLLKGCELWQKSIA